jgi:hypothetical protein
MKFYTKTKAIWVSGNHNSFDRTELGDWPKEEREKVRFEIFPLTPTLVKRIRKEIGMDNNVTLDATSNPVQLTRDAKLNEEYLNALIENVLPNWEGVYDEDEKEIPCTLDNKKLLFDNGYPILGQQIVIIASQLMAKQEKYAMEKREEQLKNSGTSQDG